MAQIFWIHCLDIMAVNESSILSKSCEACIQAKQAHKSFLQEAEHQSLEPGEKDHG